MKGAIAYDRLREAVAAKKKMLGLKLRDVAAQTGVSRPTLSRLLQEAKPLSPDSFSKLVAWLGLPPEAFVGGGTGAVPEGSTEDRIEWAIRNDPALAPEAADVLSELMRVAYRTNAGGGGGGV